MAGDGAVGGFRFQHFAVWRHEDRGHQTERAKALRHSVGLHIAVIVFARPNKAARPFHSRRDHIVDQAMLIR